MIRQEYGVFRRDPASFALRLGGGLRRCMHPGPTPMRREPLAVRPRDLHRHARWVVCITCGCRAERAAISTAHRAAADVRPMTGLLPDGKELAACASRLRRIDPEVTVSIRIHR